jgi:hypothetical protein
MGDGETTTAATPTAAAAAAAAMPLPMPMIPSRVWVQLYYEGQTTPEGSSTRVNLTDDDAIVDDLKKTVKIAYTPKLDYCAVADLSVYEAGTDVPVSPGTKGFLNPDDGVPTGTGANSPLIVVAPQQTQQHNTVSRSNGFIQALRLNCSILNDLCGASF